MSLRPTEVDFEQEWNKLKRTVESVICLHQVAKKEWTDRFSDVYRLCTARPQPYPDLLYEETRKFLKDHVERLYTKLYERCCWEGGDLLELYYKEWQVYRDGISHMDKIYWYLNSQHLKKAKLSDADITYAHPDATELKLEIGESGLLFWRKYMIEPLGQRLVYLILEYIEKDRLGNSFNENMVRSVIDSFVVVESYKKKEELEFYETLFEKPFLEATRQYYSREAENLIANNDCSQYMEKVLKRLDSEALRCRKYLHSSSYLKVKNVCEDEMVSHHLEFLTAECHKMVASENRKDLNNLYKLLRPVGQGIQHLVGEVEKHFVDIGHDAISNLPEENMANSFVENLLDAHRKQRELVEKVFNMDQQFLHAVDKASSCVINRRFKPKSKVPCCSAELLAKYCDNLLKKSARSVSESDIEEKLTQSITIFRYIEDKDVFSKFYAKMLAKRLIHCLWISLELEESMVNRLKQACGHEFTSKFHRMLTDITVSQDLNKNFREWCEKEKREIGNFNFNIFILQAGAWPIGSTALSPFSIPQVLERPCSYFEAFYRDAFQGRNLTFLHHLGTCEIRIGYTTRPYIASMSTYFMAIFLLFEDTDKLTFKEIQTNTSLPDELLVKHLSFLVDFQMLHVGPESPNQTDSQNSSLSTGSDPASTKSASGSSTARTILPDSVFSLNHEFSHKRTRIKILTVPQKEVSHQQEVERTHASIEEDRKLFLQASIVRIMKARKQMKHNILVQEVIEQARSRFTPSVPMVKKCIEALIEKQYIERATAADEYSYVA